ncbi:flavin reductase family protein [Terribacillus saccharophilus]|uniref:flavin reductase family protein n=1 Tax=Terribacillus saccharophilus TaxID=361277 RepID=UPI002989A589|nr:flavin reductase family protein [Terribacillus saccharophilus]MCM3226959.1 flavin reductase family protein [Terribacillus saccharophilus]
MMETKTINPKILYYGNPVVLLTTVNEDGTTNISPISSSWALDHFLVIGLGTTGKAYENLLRRGECVLNIPSPDLWQHVERLAACTGKDIVPSEKAAYGYTYVKDKFYAAGLTRKNSTVVSAEAIAECPLQIEAEVRHIRELDYMEGIAIIEVQAVAIHAQESIIKDGKHIDPSKWSPLIYNFRHYFGLGEELGKTARA